MKRELAGLLLAVCCAWQSTAAAQESIFGTGAAKTRSAEPGEAKGILEDAIEAPSDPVEAALASLDLRGKICQLMMVTPEGLHAPSTDDLAFLQAYTPGAVIVRRAAQPEGARRYVAKLRGAERINGIPLLIGADLHRLSQRDRGMASGFVQLPSLLAISAAHDSGAAKELATLIAEHMRMMGFNFYVGPPLELAPSLSSAKGSIHNFGSDPAFAAAAGVEIADVLDAHGLLPMPMGFPGGGANHAPNARAVLTTPRGLLPERDLLPYIRAIDAGARLLHVGNVLTPTLGIPPKPASQSEAVLRELLRGELGYDGVVVAGPIDGPGLVGAGDPKEAALAALAAGADMLMWNRADSLVMGAVAYIEAAVEAGLLSEAVIDAAATRVLRLKFSHAERLAGMKPPKKTLTNQRKLEATVRGVERRAITVIQNRGQVLPMREANAMPVMVTGVVGARVLRDGLEKYMKPISQRRISTARSLGRIERFEIERITNYVRGIRTAVLIFTEDLEAEGAVALIRGLREKGIRVVVVLLGYPALAPQFSEADAIVLAYSDNATYEQTLSAVVKTLVGEGAVSIVPAAGDLDARAGEERSFNVYETIRTPAGRLPVALGDLFPAGLALPCNPEHALRKAAWDFGDGSKSKSGETTHTYKKPGRYILTLTIEDQSKQETSRTFNVLVRE